MVKNSNHNDTSTTSPSSLSRKRLTPLPLLFDDLYMKTTHFMHISDVVGKNLSVKFSKTLTLRVFIGSKDISN